MKGQGRPFLFCRYQITVKQEGLNPRAQFNLLAELQGQPAAHGARAEAEKNFNTLLMRPRKFKVENYDVYTWSVGVTVGKRLVAKYDKEADKIDLEMIKDGTVRFNDFVAVPGLGILAVDDRGGDLHLGGKQAINRLRSVLSSKEDADINVIFEASPAEVTKALGKWKLTQVKFTVQPNNPRPVSRLSAAFGEQMKRDGIGVLTATAKPLVEHMKMSDDGLLAPVAGLVEAGYGQISVAGITEEGLKAEIKKPPFDPNVEKNEVIQQRPRELRVYVEDHDASEDEIAKTTAQALIKFEEDED